MSGVRLAVSDEILAARHFGVVHCDLSSLPDPTTRELAQKFGLHDREDCYREIDEASARASVLRLLHRDMASDAEVMPVSHAECLSDRFFAQFGAGSRYFTNNWCSATDATFDDARSTGPGRGAPFNKGYPRRFPPPIASPGRPKCAGRSNP